MQLRAEKFTIALRQPFRIAHGSSATRDTILVSLTDSEGRTAYGEGALPPYYPSTAQSCLDWLSSLAIDGIGLSDSLAEQIALLPPAPLEAAAGRVALEIALHDWWGQRMQQPLWRLWGLHAYLTPPGARTISIPADERELTQALAEGRSVGFRRFKLKVGCGDTRWDEEIVRLAWTKQPDARFSVDANGAWSPQEAAQIIPRLARCDYVEQPIPAPLDGWRDLRALLSGKFQPPLVADESVQSLADLAALRGFAFGVNIKLLKAGGLAGARRWIETARSLGLRVMIGVMVETGIGRTAAAQLAPLANWLDIDPADSIPAEPMVGFQFVAGALHLSERPGLGLEKIPA